MCLSSIVAASVCVHHMRVWCQQNRKMVLDLLELELWKVGSLHVGAGTKPRPSSRAASALNC